MQIIFSISSVKEFLFSSIQKYKLTLIRQTDLKIVTSKNPQSSTQYRYFTTQKIYAESASSSAPSSSLLVHSSPQFQPHQNHQPKWMVKPNRKKCAGWVHCIRIDAPRRLSISFSVLFCIRIDINSIKIAPIVDPRL